MLSVKLAYFTHFSPFFLSLVDLDYQSPPIHNEELKLTRHQHQHTFLITLHAPPMPQLSSAETNGTSARHFPNYAAGTNKASALISRYHRHKRATLSQLRCGHQPGLSYHQQRLTTPAHDTFPITLRAPPRPHLSTAEIKSKSFIIVHPRPCQRSKGNEWHA